MNTQAAQIPADNSQVKIAGLTYVVEGSVANAPESNVNKFRAARGYSLAVADLALRLPRGKKHFTAILFADGSYSRVTSL